MTHPEFTQGLYRSLAVSSGGVGLSDLKVGLTVQVRCLHIAYALRPTAWEGSQGWKYKHKCTIKTKHGCIIWVTLMTTGGDRQGRSAYSLPSQYPLPPPTYQCEWVRECMIVWEIHESRYYNNVFSLGHSTGYIANLIRKCKQQWTNWSLSCHCTDRGILTNSMCTISTCIWSKTATHI